MTKTRSFGSSRREAHDASPFYQRNLYLDPAAVAVQAAVKERSALPRLAPTSSPLDDILCQSAERLPLPEDCVALAFTSPPYNVGKDYDADLSLAQYLALIRQVAGEVYRVLKPGGRYVVNIANLGRKPYIPLHAHFYQVHQAVGFLPMGEIIWQKGKAARSSCAWGSWRSARSPRLRDIHEYLLVFAKEQYTRPERGDSDISSDEFMQATLSVWNIRPESARKVGHPAPFPLALAERVIRLYSFAGDLVLDPFCGSGTTCVAAARLGRHYLGVDISTEYCDLARKRLSNERSQSTP